MYLLIKIFTNPDPRLSNSAVVFLIHNVRNLGKSSPGSDWSRIRVSPITDQGKAKNPDVSGADRDEDLIVVQIGGNFFGSWE